MKKKIKITLCIIYIFALLLSGCKSKEEKIIYETDIKKAVDDFAFEDSFDFDPDLIEVWTGDEGQKMLKDAEADYKAEVTFIRANLAMNEQDTESAMKMFDACLEMANPDQLTDLYAKCLYEKARQSVYNEDYETAYSNIDRIQEIYEGKDNRNIQVRLNTLWAYELLSLPDGVDKSVELMLSTKNIAEEHNYYDMEYVLYQLASSYSYANSMMLANNYYSEALEMAKKSNDSYWSATIASEIGGNYLTSQKYDKALEYFEEAQKEAESNSSGGKMIDEQDVYLADQIAQTYIGLKEFDKAEKTLEEEKANLEILADGKTKDDYLTNYYATLGRYYAAIDNYDEAIKCFDLALERHNEDEYSFFYNFDCYLYECYGDVYIKMKEYDKAFEFLKKAEAIYLSQGYDMADLECLNKIYQIYFKKGEYEKALEYAEKRIQLLDERYMTQEKQNEDYMLEKLKANEKEAEIERLRYRNRSLDMINISGGIVVILAVLYIVNIVRKNKKIKALNERLTRISEVDELSKMKNRRSLTNYLDGNWSEINANCQPISVAMMDIDFFKKYNDFYGHQAGDEVIRKVAECIMNNCRETDFSARYGGEEFLVIMPNTTRREAVNIFNSIKMDVLEAGIKHEKSDVSNLVTISVGIATSTSAIDYLSIIHYADNQLYIAKSTRNTIESFEIENI